MAVTSVLQPLAGRQLTVHICSAFPGVVSAGIGAPDLRRAAIEGVTHQEDRCLRQAGSFLRGRTYRLRASHQRHPQLLKSPPTQLERVLLMRLRRSGGRRAQSWNGMCRLRKDSECEANVTLSRCIPVTRRPFIESLPPPRKELSRCNATVTEPPEFWIWTRSALDAFSTV